MTIGGLAAALLEAVLDGFPQNRPLAVSRMMACRNVLVKPLGLRVRNTNWFGWVYMLLIDRTHKRYVSPTMLRLAVDFAVQGLRSIL